MPWFKLIATIVLCLVFLVFSENARAADRLKPAQDGVGEFDNPLAPDAEADEVSRGINESHSKPSKKVALPQKTPVPAAGVESSPSESHGSKEVSVEPAAERVAEPSAEPVQVPVGESENIINALDTAPPLQPSYGWLWFAVICVALLLLTFFVA